MRERFLARRDVLRRSGKRVLLLLIPDTEMMLPLRHHLGFGFAGGRGLATAHAKGQRGQDQHGRTNSSNHSVTCRVRVMVPWPEPQKCEQWPMNVPTLSGVNAKFAGAGRADVRLQAEVGECACRERRPRELEARGLRALPSSRLFRQEYIRKRFADDARCGARGLGALCAGG